jgi:hypothetical protein
MTFKWFRLLPVAVISMFPALSYAQSLCEPGGVEQELELRRALPPSCQKERLQASGRVSFNIVHSAEKIANEAWRREAVTKYGERFAEVRYMACKRVLCVRGSIAGTQRCTIAGFPCAADMNDQEKALVRQVESGVGAVAPGGYQPPVTFGTDPDNYRAEMTSLREDDVKRLQELLGVNPDGDFGPESFRALREFRRSAGIRADGPPTREDLERAMHRR